MLQPTTIPAAPTAGVTTTTDPTTEKESLAEDSSSELEKPEKLQERPAEKTQASGDLKSDSGLRSAVSKINPDYVIEEIVSVPGKLVISTSSSAKLQRKATGRTSPNAESLADYSSSEWEKAERLQKLLEEKTQTNCDQGHKKAKLSYENGEKKLKNSYF